MKTPTTQSERHLVRLLMGSALAIVGFVGVVSILGQNAAAPASTAQPKTVDLTNEIAQLRAEIERLKGLVPDQAHAMQDVGYHFNGLWFAGRRQNWPLAQFYFNETRSHLRWAVRIIPVRKTKGGDLELKGILDAVEASMLSEIQKAIDGKNVSAFTNACHLTLTGCYSCHVAAEKPFLRPQIPTLEAEHTINMDPEAKGP